MQPTSDNKFWQFDPNYWFQKLNSSANGLSQKEAGRILLQSHNFKQQKSAFEKEALLFFGQFKSPLMLLLIGAVLKPQKTDEVPYDFLRKRLSIAIDKTTEKVLITKGAFTQILNICSQIRLNDGSVNNFTGHQKDIEKRFEQFGIDGLRVIGICYKSINVDKISKEDEKEMVFAGFIVLQDPVKQGIIETIEALKKLHVNLKIITGDNKNVAKSIALSIGIKNPVVMTGQELFNVSTEALKNLVKKTHIFAEVEPQQKEHLIQALRTSYTVAYTGDGINDVSAIKAADVGISVENAVDVAREAAD